VFPTFRRRNTSIQFVLALHHAKSRLRKRPLSIVRVAHLSHERWYWWIIRTRRLMPLTATLNPSHILGQEAHISTPRKASHLVKGSMTLSRRHAKLKSPDHRPYLQPSTLFTPRMSVQALPTTQLSTGVEGGRCPMLKATGLHMCISSVSHFIYLWEE
jgi:hypothetical protein